MTGERTTIATASVADLLQRAEGLVGAGAEPSVFCRGLVAELSREFAGTVVAVWRVSEDQQPICVANAGLNDPSASPATDDQLTAIRAIASGDVRRVPCAERSSKALLCATQLVDRVRVVLQVDGAKSGPSRPLLVDLVDVFAELERRALLSTTLKRSQRFGDVMQLTTKLHESLNRTRLLNTAANDGAVLIGADRIFVAQRSGWRGWKIVAATGVTRPNPRADEIRAVVRHIVTAASGRADDGEANPVVKPVAESGQWSGARFGVLIEPGGAFDSRTADLLLHHVRIGIENSRRIDEATLWGRVKRIPRAILRPTSVLFVVALSSLVAWLWFGTAELAIAVAGEAVPVTRKTIYAPEAGTITTLRFGDQADASRGEVLLTIDSEELDLEQEQIAGEIATLEARLAALETRRGGSDRQAAAEVSAEKARLQIQLASNERQLAIIEERLRSLTITVPFDGTVFLEGQPHEWVGRPVQRGEPVAELADRSGDWELRLHIPERDIRHVWDAHHQESEPAALSFVFETSPEVEHETRLSKIKLATAIDDRGELTTEAIADLPITEMDQDLADRRPGAGVLASIRCGTRRAGFVYFRRVIEFCQRRVWPW